MLALLPTVLLGELVEPMVALVPNIRSAPMPMMGPEGLQLMGLLDELKQQLDRPAPAPVANPCAEDIKRLHCTDAACLKRSTETLAPLCASMLLSKLEPSPAPEPIAVHRSPDRSPAGSGHFTVMTSGSDGHIQRITGSIPMGSLTIGGDVSVMTPGFGSMLSMLPPEIRQFVVSGMALEEEEPEPEPETQEAQHPCAREVSACVRETGCNSRTAIEGCLVKHIAQLSAECRCFVHHITNGRVSTTPPAKPVAVTPVATISQPVAIRVVSHNAEVREALPRMQEHTGHVPPITPVHRLSCLLVFTLLFLLSFLVVRAIVKLLCCQPRGRTVVLVPPESTRIKTVGATPPLLVSELTKPVQVAEPLSTKNVA